MMPDGSFDAWADSFAADWVRANPQQATIRQYFSGQDQDALDRKLSLANPYGGTYGVRAAQTRAELARRGIESLAQFRRADLTPAQQTSAALIERRLEDAVADAEFARQRFVFNQFMGLHVTLMFFLSTMHPIRNARDAENYLARLALVPDCLDEGIAEAAAAADAGIVPPNFILERTIEQLDVLAGSAPEAHSLATTFANRLKAVENLQAQAQRDFVEKATGEIRERILPALGRVRALLAEQLPRSTENAGAWSLPNGAAYYGRALASATGSPLGASEIHAIGLREVARIEREMDAILRELGYADGSLSERVGRLNETLRVSPEPDPRDAIVARLQALVDDAERRSRASFNLRPHAPAIVKREPAFSERSAAAHYTPPAPDGSQPGVYWVPLADLSPQVPWLGVGLRSTVYHEAIPGHHFQLAIELESTALPRFRRLGAFGYDPSFAEGWALYSEHLCAENGWYDGDLPSRLGYLSMQLFRARRLVVDTGLHDLRWTRQKAIDYGFTVAEIERYVAWPGQACSYMIGQLRIIELREKARRALGERFAITEFHDLILGGGTLPLAVLEREVENYLRLRPRT